MDRVSDSAIPASVAATRASFDLPAALRNSAAVSSLRVIAIPAMPASIPRSRIESEIANLGNPKKSRPDGPLV